MYCDPEYGQKVADVFASAKVKEKAWIKKNFLWRFFLTRRFPSPFRPYQEYWMDSPPESRVAPSHPPCPRCRAPELEEIALRETVGPNGDGEGTRYTMCPVCGWTIWWRYDDSM